MADGNTPPDRPPQASLKPALRTIAAVVLGVIVANVIILVTEIVDSAMHPMPAGASARNHEDMLRWIQQLPSSAFALLLFGWTFGAFMGGVVAGRIERPAWARNAIVVGALLLGGSVLNMRSLPHPTWMWVAAFVTIIPAAYIGGRTGATR